MRCAAWQVIEEGGLAVIFVAGGSTEVAWLRVTFSKRSDGTARCVLTCKCKYLHARITGHYCRVISFTCDGGTENDPQWTQCLSGGYGVAENAPQCLTGGYGGAENAPQWTLCLGGGFTGDGGAENAPQWTQCLGGGDINDASPPPRTEFATAV